MVNTWANSYCFQTDGVRVLFVLPQSWTDAFIPLNIAPQPKKVVRVMVGRLEMLSASRERAAEAAIRSLAAHDSAQSGPAFRFLHEQGRYIEPIVQARVAKTTPATNQCEDVGRLLLTGFVTETPRGRSAMRPTENCLNCQSPSCSAPTWPGCCARSVKIPRPGPRQTRF